MRINLPSLLLVPAASVVSEATSPPVNFHPEVYRAEITEIPGTESGVTGVVYVFAAGGDENTKIGYAGFAAGAQPDLQSSTCNATNGCGVHVHAGYSCADTESQRGHFWLPEDTPDPWLEERYSSNVNGEATFAGTLDIGSDDVTGRAFVFHNEDGSRAGCGLLSKVMESELFRTAALELSSSGVSGHVVAHPVKDGSDHVCFFAKAYGLEPNLVSYLKDDNSISSADHCTAENGCGMHFHSGYSCENSTTQGGHMYNKAVVQVDPWLNVSYLSTDGAGYGYHAECVVTGETEFAGRAFIIHANDGSRVACGLMEQSTTTDSPSSSSVLKVVAVWSSVTAMSVMMMMMMS